MEDPILLQYELGSIEKIYQKTLKIISPGNEASGYKCARYKPLTYVRPEFINEVLEAGGYNEEGKENKLPLQQQNIHDFIKRMMVRRFESSTHSFSITLIELLNQMKELLNILKKMEMFLFIQDTIPDIEDLFEMSTADNIHIDELDLEEDQTRKSNS